MLVYVCIKLNQTQYSILFIGSLTLLLLGVIFLTACQVSDEALAGQATGQQINECGRDRQCRADYNACARANGCTSISRECNAIRDPAAKRTCRNEAEVRRTACINACWEEAWQKRLDRQRVACVPLCNNPEACNARDDNCNGQIDEGVLNACGQCGPVPQEICDGQDNDCNGQVDEMFNVQTDINNCGSCGNVCPQEQNCENGACVAPVVDLAVNCQLPPPTLHQCNGNSYFNNTPYAGPACAPLDCDLFTKSGQPIVRPADPLFNNSFSRWNEWLCQIDYLDSGRISESDRAYSDFDVGCVLCGQPICETVQGVRYILSLEAITCGHVVGAVTGPGCPERLPLGTECSGREQCASGFCGRNEQGQSVCLEQLPLGSRCSNSFACASGICGMANDRGGFACSEPRQDPVNARCQFDTECSSGLCIYDAILQDMFCKEPNQPLSAPCFSPNGRECSSGLCGFNEEGERVCEELNQAGERCRVPAECASRRCDTVAGVLRCA